LLGRVGWGELKLISFVITIKIKNDFISSSPNPLPLERAKSKLFVDEVLAEAYT